MLKPTTIAPLLMLVAAIPAMAADAEETFTARVTMIDNDTSPATTPGPGDINGGIVAFDMGFRSLFVELAEPQTISTIVLESDAGAQAEGTSNRNLTAETLELYWSSDNVTFEKVPFRYSAPDKGTIVLNDFEVEAKYLKIHTTCDRGTEYAFTNSLSKMAPTFTQPSAQERIWGRPYLSDENLAAVHGRLYHDLQDPLFEELMGDVPGPERVLYWAGNVGDELGRVRPWFRAYAKRFGYRYVFEEQLEEAAEHNLVAGGKARPDLERHGIETWRFIIGDPGEPFVPSIDGMPMVFETQGWLMDPRWQKEYLRRAVKRAKAREQWALSAGDETWEVFAIKPVPPQKRYDEVNAADEEIRDEYGFGKYGMPTTEDPADPFERIAHRRWVSDKLTELFRETYEECLKVNPDNVMMAPDFASGVPAGDIEAWAPYFDIFQAQCANAPTPFVGRFCVGCDTKVLVDLSGKPCWMSVQNATPVDRGHTVAPEYVREMYSQVFRNGGHGLFLLASEWYERELNHPKCAEPAKWRALLYVVDTVTKMNLPRLPEADCAILYSSDSLLTLRWAQLNNGDWELYSAYAALGPLLRSWFDIVSDRQIERGVRDLSDYKVLYIPFAEYERISVLEKVRAYVQAGGTVVCTDSEAFSWDLSGESLTDKWEKLTGVRREAQREGEPAIQTVTAGPLPLDEELSLTALVPGWRIVPLTDDVDILATFDDGSPAITLHPYGEGKVIFFAADPFVLPGGWSARASLVEPGAPIVSFVEAIQEFVGAQMGHDIWRFKLPPFPTDMYQKETDVCLTNNYVYDRNEPYLEENNLETDGTYTYSRPPTGLPDAGEPGEPIPFAEGHLTNREEAYRTRSKQFEWDVEDTDAVTQAWIVSWTDPDPVTVTFDLKDDYPLAKCRLIYSGTLPALTVSGSRDGEAWQELASDDEETAGDDVIDFALPLEGEQRYVKLDFAARDNGDKFELCEVEIWGGERLDNAMSSRTERNDPATQSRTEESPIPHDEMPFRRSARTSVSGNAAHSRV